ncbi:hypothetical protein MIR68_010426 [Amoeboaphelidium protococcarum]|nr:hypothetical protein MIR68_010426 [Amoeboaphelidium protococcarum]
MLKSGLRLSTRTPLKGRGIAPCQLSHSRYSYGTVLGNGVRTVRNGGNVFYSTASSGAANNVVQFNLADIGEGITECELVQWYVKTGSKIQQFDKICEVQSDKATVEITSRYDGIVSKLYYEKGQMAKVGSPLVDIQLEGSSNSRSEAGQQAPPQQQQQEQVVVEPHVKDASVSQKVKAASAEQQSNDQRVYKAGTVNENVLATPAVRRMAKEMKIDLNSVKGTGRDGRITKEDLLSYSPGADQGTQTSSQSTPQQQQQSNQSSFQSGGSAKWSGQQTATTPPVVKLTGVQKAMLKGMSQSLRIPHFGFSDEIEFDQLSALRAGINKDLALNQNPSAGLAKISFMPLLLKSFSVALQRYPLLNAKLQQSDQFEDSGSASLLYRSSHNIGVAIDSPGGLVVPNIKAVDQKSILEIALDLQRLVDLAKKGQLPPDAFKDITITMSNIGNIGGRVLSPVIPPDTLCIVAIGRIQSLPRFVNNGDEDSLVVTKKQIVTASFSADHRVVDGATVAKFFAEWKSLIEDPAKMLMNLR